MVGFGIFWNNNLSHTRKLLLADVGHQETSLGDRCGVVVLDVSSRDVVVEDVDAGVVVDASLVAGCGVAEAIRANYISSDKQLTSRAVVVAQVAERWLPNPEVSGSNSFISQI